MHGQRLQHFGSNLQVDLCNFTLGDAFTTFDNMSSVRGGDKSGDTSDTKSSKSTVKSSRASTATAKTDKSKFLQQALLSLAPTAEGSSSATQRGRSSASGSNSTRTKNPKRSPPPKGVLERRLDDQSRSRSPQLPDRGPNTCDWCGGKAANSSGSEQGPLDQCEQHRAFHGKTCSTVPWKMLCSTYHSNPAGQAELDKAVAHFSQHGRLPVDKTSNVLVDKSDCVDAEVYLKYSLMSQARLEAEIHEAGLCVSDKNIALATNSLPNCVLPVPGSARKQRYWIFPFVSGDLPVLKLSAGTRLGKSMMILNAEDNAYAQHGSDSFRHLADTDSIDIDESKMQVAGVKVTAKILGDAVAEAMASK